MALLQSQLTGKTQAELIAIIDAMQQANSGKLSLKVSVKGAVSCYGMTKKFPVTLYAQQWERLLDNAEQIRAFIEANKSALSMGKDDPRFAKTADAE